MAYCYKKFLPLWVILYILTQRLYLFSFRNWPSIFALHEIHLKWQRKATDNLKISLEIVILIFSHQGELPSSYFDSTFYHFFFHLFLVAVLRGHKIIIFLRIVFKAFKKYISHYEPHSFPLWWAMQVLHLCFRWGNWDSEMLHDLAKVTQVESGRVRSKKIFFSFFTACSRFVLLKWATERKI